MLRVSDRPNIAARVDCLPTGEHWAVVDLIAVHAVDVDSPAIDEDATPAYLYLTLLGHALARAVVVPWCESESVADAESNAA